MTVTLPNYIFEKNENYQLINDNKIIVSKSSQFKKDKMSLRNSMHLAILLVKGGKILHLEEKDIQVDTTNILYLSQGNYFMSELLGNNKEFESIIIFFDDDFVLNFIKRYKINLNTKEEKIFLNLKRDEFINFCIENINQYFKKDISNSIDLVKLKLDELFLYSLAVDKDAFSAFLNAIVNTKASRVKYILESNLDIISSVDDMCKITRLNSKALRKEMLRLYNQNPKEWLDSQRLLKAQNLLKNTDKAISDVATSCGYSSVSWFINQFKKQYKTTPLLYREQCS